MGFPGYLRDLLSGKIAKSNRLIGNHAVRISGKVKDDVTSLLSVIVGGTAYCTTDFLVELLFEVKKFKYADGTEEPNPFKEYLDRLNEKSSYEMFKLVAGNFFAALLAKDLLPSDKAPLGISELKDQFLNIYEYDSEDKEIFTELLKLGQEGGRPSSEFRLYEYIFRRAYNMKPPELVSQIMNFELMFKNSFAKIFLPGLLDALKTANKLTDLNRKHHLKS